MNISFIKTKYLGLVACTAAALALIPQPASAQSLIDGYWNPLLHQDGWAYAGGPDQADFAGMPITPAALTLAHAWDPGQAMLTSLQCAPFNALYGPRSLSILRIWETRDPYTNQQATIETQMGFAALHRKFQMLPHDTPPPFTQHSWEGYSTGKWVGNTLWVHTDRLKHYSTRAGQPFSDKATMDERFFRYGDVLVDIMIMSDPQYLSRPWVYSKLYYRIPNGNIDPYPCTASEQVKRDKGMVPMHLPGHVEIDGFIRNGIPVESAEGGEKTMYPEYQDYMKTLPPNPSLEEVLQQLQRASEEEARLR